MCSGILASLGSKVFLGLFDRLRKKEKTVAEDSVQAEASDRSHAGKYLRDRLRIGQSESGPSTTDHTGPSDSGTD